MRVLAEGQGFDGVIETKTFTGAVKTPTLEPLHPAIRYTKVHRLQDLPAKRRVNEGARECLRP